MRTFIGVKAAGSSKLRLREYFDLAAGLLRDDAVSFIVDETFDFAAGLLRDAVASFPADEILRLRC